MPASPLLTQHRPHRIFEGTVSTLVERAQLRGLSKTGEIVRQTRRMGDWVGGVKDGAKFLGKQYAQEQVQSVIAPATELFVSRWREDMPDKDLVQEILNYSRQMPENFAATLIVALVGGGFVSTRNLMLSRKQIVRGLEMHGAPKEALDRVASADESQLDAEVAKVFENLTPEEKQAAARRMRRMWVESGVSLEGLSVDVRTTDQGGVTSTTVEARHSGDSGWSRTEYGVRLRGKETESSQGRQAEDADVGGRILFSKGNARRTPQEIGEALIELSRDERTRIYGPTPTAKDLPTILQTLAPERAGRIEIVEGAGKHGKRGYTFKDSQGGEIFSVRDYEGVYHVDSIEAKGDGTPIYQAIYAWAHNNGIQIQEDTTMTVLRNHENEGPKVGPDFAD